MTILALTLSFPGWAIPAAITLVSIGLYLWMRYDDNRNRKPNRANTEYGAVAGMLAGGVMGLFSGIVTLFLIGANLTAWLIYVCILYFSQQ